MNKEEDSIVFLLNKGKKTKNNDHNWTKKSNDGGKSNAVSAGASCCYRWHQDDILGNDGSD